MRISDWSSDVCSSDLVWFNRVHSFATSWAFEMETIILGWYVLVETGSVLLLTVFASLQYIGTLIAPMFGVIGDRIGYRNLLCAMRAAYTVLAATLMTFAYLDALSPAPVFAIAALIGVLRPSDIRSDERRVGNECVSTCSYRR